MNGLLSIWVGSDSRQRLIAALAAIAALLALGGLASVALSPSMSLLYAGLDQNSAGAVVSALEARGVPYQVRGDGIFVESGQRDATRMALASDGLPESGAAGYELLDSLSGFGTTAEMFDAAYWRAKEGELARTILALPSVRKARVHVANPVRRPFQDGGSATASIVITTKSGALSARQAEAIRFLVASAIAGLQTESVSVIDADRGVVLRAGEAGMPGAAGGEDKAESLRRNVERLLAARVGAESVIVEVSVDTDRNAEKITERVLDPESRVAVSTDTEKSADESTGGGAGDVTVASNLPDGDVETNGGGSSANSTRTRERVNYEVSEVLRERTRNPGEVRRISVAVLVDGNRVVGPDGVEVWEARPETELNALRTLVESTIGFDEGRGDVISIQSMEFAQTAEFGGDVTAGAGGFFAANAMTLIQLAVLSLVVMALGLFVLRPMMQADAANAVGAIEGPDGITLGPASLGSVERSIEAAGELIDADGVGVDQLTALRDAVQERPEDSAFLLRSWLESDDKTGKAA